MPTFRPFSTCIELYENRPVLVIRPVDLPIRNHEDPENYSGMRKQRIGYSTNCYSALPIAFAAIHPEPLRLAARPTRISVAAMHR